MPDSRFFFVGSSVLSVVFASLGAWVLLALPLLVMFIGIWRADMEQISELDNSTLAMFVAESKLPLLPLDGFIGHHLLFYQDGLPVYHDLFDGNAYWQWLEQDSNIAAGTEIIRVVPGNRYRRLDGH